MADRFNGLIIGGLLCKYVGSMNIASFHLGAYGVEVVVEDTVSRGERTNDGETESVLHFTVKLKDVTYKRSFTLSKRSKPFAVKMINMTTVIQKKITVTVSKLKLKLKKSIQFFTKF